MAESLSLVQHVIVYVQNMLFSPYRLEHAYLIALLFILLVVVTEKLRNPNRKLRNRSDRMAWGRR